MTKARGKIRRGWAARLLSTGRIAGSAAKLTTRQVFGAGDEGGVIGQRIAAELDQRKGIAMKVGQILSYFDGILPEETHAALRMLQVGSEPVGFAMIAGVIEEAFGAPPGELFERFDEKPIAAASIGQVHRARFDGREVAVKVQYPGVRETMVADVSRLRSLSRTASLATAVDGPAIVAELAERFRLECDYELEARTQNAFRAAFAGDREVSIPEALPQRTRGTVLTTAWCDGRGFYDFEAQAGEAARNRAALGPGGRRPARRGRPGIGAPLPGDDSQRARFRLRSPPAHEPPSIHQASHAQPGPLWHTLLAEMQLLPHALPFRQILQQYLLSSYSGSRRSVSIRRCFARFRRCFARIRRCSASMRRRSASMRRCSASASRCCRSASACCMAAAARRSCSWVMARSTEAAYASIACLESSSTAGS